MADHTVLSRRAMLRMLGVAGGAALLAACGGSPAPQGAAEPATQSTAAGATSGGAATTTAQAPASNSFTGKQLIAALIGGGSYDKLYTRLDEWQQRTGAKVDTSTRLAHGDLNTKLRQEYASGKPSFNWASDHTIFWPEWQIGLEPLDSYVDASDLADFTPSVVAACKGSDGKLYVVPRHVDAQLMYYRKDLFADPKEQADFKAKYGYELRPPATWKEWSDVAAFFTRPPNLFGFVAAGGGDFGSLLATVGGQLLDAQNRPAWNSDTGKQALKQMVSLYKVRNSVPEGSLQYGWDDVTQLFRTGKVAFYFEWPGWYQQLKDPAQSQVVGKFDIAPIPAGPSGPQALKTLQGSHAFAIAKASENKDASADAIRWITSPDSEFFEFTEGGFLPVRTSVWSRVHDYVASKGDALDKKRLDLLQKTIKDNFWTYPSQQVPQYQAVASETLAPNIQKTLLGELSVDEALAQSATAAEAKLQELGAIK